ncbi:MAG TPA: hypothetical protein DCG57_12580 [Candidatus Riflebacteria bacterium]|jgi:hypothetical protein|nr:MAG: hypothetical protein CVV41_14165 [Candidatus Riflebacteria bacterium HGW-Riflebacteria-1]HAE39457.1 hypothetical protein [Candidatus Riflebacteria bacterium]
MRTRLALFLTFCFILTCLSAQAQTIEKNFFHQLKIGEQPQSWEHRIDLPEEAAMQGRVFVARGLDLRMGKLVIERELFTPTFYYVKVRLPKHPEVPMAGNLTVTLQIGDVISTKAPQAPTQLALSAAGATLKPIFTWKTPARYAAVSLYDLTEQKTVWERVSTIGGYIGFDEGWLKKDHRYRWAVKVSEGNGRYSPETMAGFRIEEQNGVVIAIPE